MKKLLVFVLILITASFLTLSAAAAVNSNHLIDEGYPDFNKDETKWEIFGWTCVDTPITALGYKLDGGDTVWVIDKVVTRDDAEKVRENDCFEDLELERAIIEMSLQNGLDEFYGYRMKITLDTSEMEKGAHTFEYVVKYEDGTEGNPCRETVFDITKKKAPAGKTDTTVEQTTEAVTTEEQTTAEQTTEAETTKEQTTEAVTTEEITTEAVTTGAETAEQTTKKPEETKPEETENKSNPLPVVIVVILCAVAIAAAVIAIVLKKKKK